MKKRALIIAGIARAVVWVVVVLWCLAPFLWMLIMLASSLGGGAGDHPAPPAGPMPRGDQGLFVKLMSSTLMLGAFLYGVWCAVGVAMGFGLDRAITVAEALVALGSNAMLSESSHAETPPTSITNGMPASAFKR